MGFHPVRAVAEFTLVRACLIRTDWKSILRLLGQTPQALRLKITEAKLKWKLPRYLTVTNH